MAMAIYIKDQNIPKLTIYAISNKAKRRMTKSLT